MMLVITASLDVALIFGFDWLKSYRLPVNFGKQNNYWTHGFPMVVYDLWGR